MPTPGYVIKETNDAIASGTQTQQPMPIEGGNLAMARVIDRAVAAGPMTYVGNHVPKSRNGKPVRWAGEDPELLERTKHVRLKGERMSQFFSRVGLGAAQIRTMSAVEISRFVDVASQNEIPRPPRRPSQR